MKLFYLQCIKGDTSDNIKGIPGIGSKGAEKILNGCNNEQELFNAVRAAYNNDSEFIMNARVLWILRSLEDNWEDRFYALIQE